MKQSELDYKQNMIIIDNRDSEYYGSDSIERERIEAISEANAMLVSQLEFFLIILWNRIKIPSPGHPVYHRWKAFRVERENVYKNYYDMIYLYYLARRIESDKRNELELTEIEEKLIS